MTQNKNNKIEKYLMNGLNPSQFSLNRREFVKLLGGGIFIFFSTGAAPAVQQDYGRPSRRSRTPTDLNAFLHIDENGQVKCYTGKIEMGQGPITSLAQTLAEELNVAYDSVEMVMGDTDLCPWDMGTFGSMTTRFFSPLLRVAAAEARAVLLDMAAEYLQLPQQRLKIENGVIFDETQKQKKVSYAELTKGKKITRKIEGEPTLESPSEFTIMGKSYFRRDSRQKVTGKALYAGDIRLPGMLYAKILRPSAFGSKLKTLDTTQAEKLEGVKIIKDGELVAALHEFPDTAEKAISLIKAQYDPPDHNLNEKTIFDYLVNNAPEAEAAGQAGNLQTGRQESAQTFNHTYLNSYVAHSPIEPHTAVVEIKDGKALIWPSTQTPFPAKDEAAQTLGFTPENVHVITPFVGGGFGGKTRNLQVMQAAKLAKITGRPIHLAWTRADELFNDTYRPAAVVKIESGITKTGKISFWDYTVYFAGERGSQHFYDIPNHRTLVSGEWMGPTASIHPFNVGPWRAPANNTNTFARECHIDIMAEKAEINPLEFRLQNLKDQKMIGVLKAAAKLFGWPPPNAPKGTGYGIACGIDAGTYVAHIAEVVVDQSSGQIQVKRVVCAQDMGFCVNPQGSTIQMEGCIMMGLGYALTEEIHFQGGEIKDLNFDTYKIPRFSWMPKIETVIIDSGDSNPQGGGEPAIVCMGAVIANAVYSATGARLFQLPMTPERIRSAAK